MSESSKSKWPRVYSRVPRAFKSRVEDLKNRLRRLDRWRYDGRDLSEEALLAVALMEFMALPEKKQFAALDRYIPEMQKQLDDAKASSR